MKRLLLSSSATLAVVVAACGGNVVVDTATHNTGSGASGVGGASGSPVTGPSVGVGAAVSVGVGASGVGGFGGFVVASSVGVVVAASSSSITVGTSGAGGSTGCFGVPPGSLTFCGGGATTTGSGMTECMANYCKPGSSDMYLSVCNGLKCVCIHNEQEVCNCVLPAGTGCPGTDCCYTP
jgi:hypothetical protein